MADKKEEIVKSSENKVNKTNVKHFLIFSSVEGARIKAAKDKFNRSGRSEVAKVGKNEPTKGDSRCEGKKKGQDLTIS